MAETSTYVVKLQNHPKTVKGLHRIRFWLRELSRVHFTDATTCCYPSLNPALVEALFPKEDIFLSLGDFKIRMLPNFMLPSIASLFRIGVLRCATHRFSDCVKTLFNELLLKSKHGVHTLDCLYYLTVSMADIIKVAKKQLLFLKITISLPHSYSLNYFFQLLDGLEYAQLKRLPSEMQFRNVVFGSLKNLKHIETTGETEKYELLVRNSGCMKIFLVRTRGMQQRLTVHLIDQ
jgi:hypothetical protein